MLKNLASGKILTRDNLCTTGDGSLWYKLEQGPAFAGSFLFAKPVPCGAVKIILYFFLQKKQDAAYIWRNRLCENK
jgi:hypothetical protein